MILYFSATGNSRHIAETISKELSDENVADLSYYFKHGTEAPEFNLSEGECIGFVFPVHSWGMPKGLKRLIERCSIKNYEPGRNYCYMICTCGDDAGLVATRWKKAVEHCGLRSDAAYSVFMPNTYVLLPGFDVDTPETANKKLHDSANAIKEIAANIKMRKKGDFTHHGSFCHLKSDIIYTLFSAFMTDKPFRCDAAKCISCKKCSKSCPVGNIEMRKGHPEWEGHCINCLACYHHCPTKAIAYGKVTGKKGRYIFPEQ